MNKLFHAKGGKVDHFLPRIFFSRQHNQVKNRAIENKKNRGGRD
jgi:hypothetical protein